MTIWRCFEERLTPSSHTESALLTLWHRQDSNSQSPNDKVNAFLLCHSRATRTETQWSIQCLISPWIKEFHSIMSFNVQTFVRSIWWWVNETLTLMCLLARKACGWSSAVPVGWTLLVKVWKILEVFFCFFFKMLHTANQVFHLFASWYLHFLLLHLIEGSPMLLRPMMMIWAAFSTKALKFYRQVVNCNLYPVHHIQSLDISGCFFLSAQ